MRKPRRKPKALTEDTARKLVELTRTPPPINEDVTALVTPESDDREPILHHHVPRARPTGETVYEPLPDWTPERLQEAVEREQERQNQRKKEHKK